MMRLSISLVSVCAFACLPACGGDDGAKGQDGSAEDSADAGSGSAGDGDGDGDATQGDGDATQGDGDATEGPEGGDGDTKWDVLGLPDTASCGGEGGGDVTHSYIWIANSSQGSVSKVNTETLVEEARYYVRETPGNPSRTSVSLSGEVAIANRSGGVVKIHSNPEICEESNGMPGIQTSTGGNDLLAWNVEECRAWYTAFAYTTQRPLAWAQGEWNDQTCSYQDEKLWTAGGTGSNHEVVLMNGDSGEVEDFVAIPNVIGWAGLYGGAVDGDGNFWTVDHNWSGLSTLIRVDRGDLSYATWPVTGDVHYGLAVDSEGRAWLCGSGGASRFDPGPETWTHLAPANPGSALGGCMEDANGVLWNSRYPDAVLVGIDTDTVTVVQEIAIPAYTHGISIDFAGYVWGVEFGGSNAYRVDVEQETFDTFSGLSGAYTYSDMTGYALSAAGTPNN